MATQDICEECGGPVYEAGLEYICTRCGLVTDIDLDPYPTEIRDQTLGSQRPDLEKIIGPKIKNHIKKITGEILMKDTVCTVCDKTIPYKTRKRRRCQECNREHRREYNRIKQREYRQKKRVQYS